MPTLTAALLLFQSCGPSLDTLNKFAAAGSVNSHAPVLVHLKIEIAASPATVWKLLIAAPDWPKWQDHIEKVSAPGPLGPGTKFTWSTGGTTIHSQVQLFEQERRLAWTGTALTAKAVHLWKLTPQPSNHTLVTVEESMDGPAMAAIFPAEKLAVTDKEWLEDLKHAAEQNSRIANGTAK